MKCLYCSSRVDTVRLDCKNCGAPYPERAPWIGPKGMFSDVKWSRIVDAHLAFLEYDPVDIEYKRRIISAFDAPRRIA